MFYSNRDAQTRHIIPFSNKLIRSDPEAWEAYPELRYFYNKLWVAKSQNIRCNTMDLPPTDKSQYPIFIKPIINLDGGNKDCYKINTPQELSPYIHQTDMFWSEYIDKQEGSSDFVVLNGKIVFELHYTIDNKQDDFIQTNTILSTKNKCPEKVRLWVEREVSAVSYTGVFNAQYRGDIIIECGLRFDAGGNYIQWTMNKNIIRSINHFLERNEWRSLTEEQLFFHERYVVECSNPYPIIYYFPAPCMKFIMYITEIENYDFYIDETKEQINFFTLVDTNIEKIYMVKQWIERCMRIVNWGFILFFFSLLILLGFCFCFCISSSYTKNIRGIKGIKNRMKNNFTYILLWSSLGILLFFTRFINPPKYLRKMI